MACVGDDKLRTYVKVRINCKYNPTSSKIAFSEHMAAFSEDGVGKIDKRKALEHFSKFALRKKERERRALLS